MKLPALFTAMLCAVATVPLRAHDIIRHANPNLPVATSVLVPAGADLLFVSGMLADAADPSAPAGSIERFGDTAAQAKSVLGKIAKELEASGFTMGGRREDERLPGGRSPQGRRRWTSRG